MLSLNCLSKSDLIDRVRAALPTGGLCYLLDEPDIRVLGKFIGVCGHQPFYVMRVIHYPLGKRTVDYLAIGQFRTDDGWVDRAGKLKDFSWDGWRPMDWPLVEMKLEVKARMLLWIVRRSKTTQQSTSKP